jgi:hypothetical protein
VRKEREMAKRGGGATGAYELMYTYPLGDARAGYLFCGPICERMELAKTEIACEAIEHPDRRYEIWYRTPAELETID